MSAPGLVILKKVGDIWRMTDM